MIDWMKAGSWALSLLDPDYVSAFCAFSLSFVSCVLCHRHAVSLFCASFRVCHQEVHLSMSLEEYYYRTCVSYPSFCVYESESYLNIYISQEAKIRRDGKCYKTSLNHLNYHPYRYSRM